MSLPANLCLILFTILPPTLLTGAQPPPPTSSRALDSLLQNHAFKAFSRPKTGVPYDGGVPANLAGIEVSALRLRSGSLRTRGFKKYREFSIPTGVTAQPYVERLVLVYQNLGNWSSLFYPFPGYTYLAPIVGLLAYNGSDLAAVNLPELDLRASDDSPIAIHFRHLRAVSNGLLPMCVGFKLDGSVEFNSVLGGGVCEITQQGHFSIIVEVPAVETPPPPPCSGSGGNRRRSYGGVWVIVAAVVGGCGWLGLLSVLVVFVRRCRRRTRIGRLEAAAEGGVALETKAVGRRSRVPVAAGTRTRPVLENDEYVP